MRTVVCGAVTMFGIATALAAPTPRIKDATMVVPATEEQCLAKMRELLALANKNKYKHGFVSRKLQPAINVIHDQCKSGAFSDAADTMTKMANMIKDYNPAQEMKEDKRNTDAHAHLDRTIKAAHEKAKGKNP